MPQGLEHSATSWKGQQLKHQQSVIDRLDPRARVVAVSAFALVVVLSWDLAALCLALAGSLLLAVLARLNLKRTLRRVIAMDLFMLFLILMLPFTTPGEPLFHIAGLPASVEGLLHAVQIALKANAVVLALLALVGTQSATTLGHALAHLRFPDKLVHLLLFTVRYLEVIGQEYKRMRQAMQARAFVLRANRHSWRSIGYLVGMLLVHSLERSERILDAMKCRGYNGRYYLFDDMQLTAADTRFGMLVALFLSLLLGINLL